MASVEATLVGGAGGECSRGLWQRCGDADLKRRVLSMLEHAILPLTWSLVDYRVSMIDTGTAQAILPITSPSPVLSRVYFVVFTPIAMSENIVSAGSADSD